MALLPASGLLVWLLGYQLTEGDRVLRDAAELNCRCYDEKVCLKMSDTDNDKEGQKSKGVFSTLTAKGDWLYLKGEYKKAIESYTTVSS